MTNTMDTLLCIERSDDSWAVSRGGDVVATGRLRASGPRAPEWFPGLVGALDEAGLGIGSIDAFLCGIGPGSFSGIRSVLAAFQGLAMPRGLPVLGLSDAAALAGAQSIARNAPTVAVVGDARRGLLWVAAYDVSADGAVAMHGSGAAPTHTSDDFALVRPDELRTAIPEGALVVSGEYGRISSAIGSLATDNAIREDLRPSAADILALYGSAPEAALRNPSPIYLHPAVVAG